MRFLGILLCAIAPGAIAQTKTVTETAAVSGQEKLDLNFAFANDITLKTWDQKEVKVVVEVNIQDGKYNDIFSMDVRTSESTIYFEMDEDMWKKVKKERKGSWNNCWTSNINYTVYAPRSLDIKASTISGNYNLTYTGSIMQLKTISGEIDLTLPGSFGLDFLAKTVSGEVYTDLKIEFPNGEKGLRQIVGQNVRGRIGKGSEESELETVSGNIYLRKG